jgi:hypothetical protein
MTLAEFAAGQRLTDGRRELEQAERVADARATLPDPVGHLFVRQPEIFDELAVAFGRFEWIEVLALEVLHQRQLEAFALVGQPDNDRDRLPASEPPASAIIL